MSADDQRRAGPTADELDPSVTAALRALTEIGQREREALRPDTMQRIARAAARERHLAGGVPDPAVTRLADELAGARLSDDFHSESDFDFDFDLDLDADLDRYTGHDVDGPTATGSAPGARPPRRRWPLLAAAAALLVGIVTAAALSGPDQVVVTDRVTDPAADGASPGPAGIDDVPNEPEGRPLLDLGDSRPESAAGSQNGTTTAPPSGSETSEATVPDLVVTDDPPEPSPTSTPATTSGQGGTTSPTSRTASGVTVAVAWSGSVDLRFADGVPEVVAVREEPGWIHTITRPSPGAVRVQFTAEADQATLDVSVDGDGFHLAVDPGQVPPRYDGVESRTFDLEAAGTVEVGWGVFGLRTLDVLVADGWHVEPDAVAPDRLELRVVGPAGGRTSALELYAEPLRIAIATVDEAAGSS